MELLERYLAAVAAELPADRASDIIRELRANLLDLLDEQTAIKGRPLSATEFNSWLEQQPHPQQMAQRYQPMQPLISSEDMPLYRDALWYGSVLLAVFVLLQNLAVLVSQNSINPIRLVLQLAFDFIEDFPLFWLVFTAAFYACARAGWTERWRQRRWQLINLPSQPQARIGITDLVSDMASSSFLLLLLWTPLWNFEMQEAPLIFILAPEMQLWCWLLTLLCFFSLLLALYRTYQRCWQRWTLALYIVELIAFAAVFIAMASVKTSVLQPIGIGPTWLQQQIDGAVDLTFWSIALVLLGLAVVELRRYGRLR